VQTRIKILEQSEKEVACMSDITRQFYLSWSSVDSTIENKDGYKTATESVG
jgi:hypothetical protein